MSNNSFSSSIDPYRAGAAIWGQIAEDHFPHELTKLQALSQRINSAVRPIREKIYKKLWEAAQTYPIIRHITHCKELHAANINTETKLKALDKLLLEIWSPPSYNPFQHSLFFRLSRNMACLSFEKVLVHSIEQNDNDLFGRTDLRCVDQSTLNWLFQIAERVKRDNFAHCIRGHVDELEGAENRDQDPLEQLWDRLQTHPLIAHLSQYSKPFKNRSLTAEQKFEILKKYSNQKQVDLMLVEYNRSTADCLLMQAIRQNDEDLFNSINLRLIVDLVELLFKTSEEGHLHFLERIIPYASEKDLSQLVQHLLSKKSQAELSEKEAEFTQNQSKILDYLLSPNFRRIIDTSDCIDELKNLKREELESALQEERKQAASSLVPLSAPVAPSLEIVETREPSLLQHTMPLIGVALAITSFWVVNYLRTSSNEGAR